MSAGSYGLINFPVPAHGQIANYRSWSGTDGKYEYYAGQQRPKWNSYQQESAAQRVPSAWLQFFCNKPGGGTDTRVLDSICNTAYRPVDDHFWPSQQSMQVNQTLNKLLSKVKGHSFNLAVNLSQMGELSEMVSSNLGKLGSAVMALKHGDFSTAARCLGASPRVSKLKPSDISGRWLELQYGWLPSLSDTYQAAKAFHAISDGPRSSRFTKRCPTQSSDAYYWSSSEFYMKRKHTRTASYTVELYEEMGFARQLGLVDPLSVIWENIPYSFVVDWFVPIGTYLDNLNQIPTLKGRWLVHSGYETQGPVEYKWVDPNGLPLCGYHGYAHRYSSVSITPVITGSYRWSNRSALASPPSVPSPDFVFGGAVHGNRIWNAISLASQRFKF
jgi:hypothetical protein